MKRILFVDDEVAILDGLRNVLRGDRHRWSMSFADSGEAALGMLAESTFDVIVADMRMPGMNGLELLERVRRDHPNVARIILSGYAELALVARASLVAHQQLLKPSDAQAVRSVIERACALQGLLASDSIRKIVGTMGALPSAPATYQALTQELENPDAPIKKLAGIVERDVGLASRVLKFVNSAYFGFAQRIGSVENAIVCMGMNALRHLVLSIEVFATFSGEVASYCSPDSFEPHALLTARIARGIVADVQQAEMAFAAGLLHDAGKLVLVSRLPKQCAEAAALASKDQNPLFAAEKEVIGADHAEIGAYLLGLWALPSVILEAVACHHKAAASGARGLDAAAAVRIADFLAHEALPPGTRSEEELRGVCTEVGILDSASDTIDHWRRLAATEAKRLCSA